jgi:hypothetical protein
MNLKPDPLNHEVWKTLAISTKVKIVWIVFTDTTWKRIEYKILKWCKRIDLWLFPPAGFWACYNSISNIIPAGHPMAFNATMATSFMFATLTLFMLRPKARGRIQVHWVNK